MEVTKADLWDVRDGIVEEMRAGFAGVHERQDTTNGRVNAQEVLVGRHDQRLKNIEREVFPRRGSAPTTRTQAVADAAGLPTGKMKLSGLVLAALAGMAAFSEAAHALRDVLASLVAK